MQNDMLKNTIAPWQEKGRWYHGQVDIATSALIADQTDQWIMDVGSVFAATGQLCLRLPDTKIRVIESKFLISDQYRRASAAFLSFGCYYTDTGYLYPAIAPTGSAGISDFWIFVVEL